ncbi:MAG: HAD-IC family P-type ATPase [Chloroflexota bacterium]
MTSPATRHSESTTPAVEDSPSDSGRESRPQYSGLTSAQVEALTSAGQVNVAPVEVGDSVPVIIRRNALSLVNILLFAISIGLVILGLYRDAVLTAGIVILNVGIGIFQEIRAKRKLRQIALLHRPTTTVIRDSRKQEITPDQIVAGDVLLIEAGDQIPVDGELLSESPLSVDESNLTGESDLVRKRQGDDLLSGSICMVGSGILRATRVGGRSMVQQITARARSYRNIKTPLQRDIDVIIKVMTATVILLASRVIFSIESFSTNLPIVETAQASAVLVALVPQGLILMVAVAYSMAALRLAPQGALIQRINSVESLSHINVLCVDKTGTLTTQQLKLREIHPLNGLNEATMREWIGDLVANTSSGNKTSDAIAADCPGRQREVRAEAPFTSARKWSGVSFDDPAGSFIMGAPEVLIPALCGDTTEIESRATDEAERGFRVLLIARDPDPAALDSANDGEPELPGDLEPVAIISIEDELRPGVQETIRAFSDIRVRLKVISGDNPDTVLALAKQAGFPESSTAIPGSALDGLDDEQVATMSEEHTVFGRVTPEHKERLVRGLQQRGNWVAMTGDGVNDILALKQASVGIAMKSGSEATRGVADMVLMNDSFEVLPHAFSEGQRVMRGMTDNIKLFLTRTLSIVFLIFFVTLIGQEFPLTPSQNSILAIVTVGIPAFAMAIWAKPGKTPRNLGRLVFEFVLPAALMVSIISFAVYDFFLSLTNNVEWSQAAVTTTLVSTLLLIVLFAQPPTPVWVGASSLNGDRRPAYLVLLMYLAYIAIVLIPSTREFFELRALPWSGYVMLTFIVIGWAVIVRYTWRRALGTRVWVFSERRLRQVSRQLNGTE